MPSEGEQLTLQSAAMDQVRQPEQRDGPPRGEDDVKGMAESAARELSQAQQGMARLALRSRTLGNITSAAAEARYCTAHLDALKASRRSEFTAGEQSVLTQFAESMREAALVGIRDLPASLPAALEALGLAVHPTSRHPRYQVDGEFITVDVDDKAMTASVSSRGGQSRRVAADPAVIAEVALAVHERLFGDGRPRMTIEALVSAYRAVAEKQSVTWGAEVPIEAVREALPRVRGKVPPQDEFNVDLAALLQTAPDRRWRVSLANTRQTDRGVLIHGMEATGYIGYLKVEERHG